MWGCRWGRCLEGGADKYGEEGGGMGVEGAACVGRGGWCGRRRGGGVSGRRRVRVGAWGRWSVWLGNESSL